MRKLLLSSALLVAVAGIAMAQVQITPAPGRFPTVLAYGRSTAQTAAVASVVTYTPAADGTFEVSANVNVTTSTTYGFTVQVTYTDEGNTSRTVSLPMTLLTGGVSITMGNGDGAGPRMGIPQQIRCKAATTITILTQAAGTYTTVTYNVEGVIKQVQ